MADSRELQLILSLRDRVSGQMKDVQGRLQKFESSFQKMALAGTAAFAGISVGIGKAISEASRVQEIDRLFDATFSNTEESMARWASDVSDKFGRAEQDIRQMAATAGSVLVPAFDISEKEVSKMTQGMGEAAIALAATDTRIENAQQAMEGFTQALTGNRQRVIDWGFQVRDKQLAMEGLKRGIIETGEELTQQQKAMLTAKLITEQVSVSTQVLKDSQEDWSQISKRLTGQLKELSAVLGKRFLAIAEEVGMRLEPVLTAVKEWVAENPKLTATLIGVAAALIGVVTVASALSLVLIALNGFILLVTAAMAAVGAIAVFVIMKWEEIKAFGEILKQGVIDLANAFSERWNQIKSATQEAVAALIETLQSFWDKWRNTIILITGLITGLYLPMLTKIAIRTTTQLAIASAKWVAHTAKVGAQIAIQTARMIPKLIASYAALAAKAVATAVKVVAQWVFMAMQSLIQAGRMAMAWIIAMGPIAWVSAIVVGLVALIIANWSTVRDKTIEIWTKISNWLQNAWKSIKEFFASVWDSMLETIKGWADTVMDFLQPVIDLINTIKSGVSTAISSVSGAVGSAVSSVTPFAEGGVVTKPTLGLVGEEGPEAIVPLDKQNGMGTTVNITVNGDVSGEELLERVQEGIMRSMRMNKQLNI